MNELRFQLEDIQHDLEQKTTHETYRLQKYENLLKPWTTTQPPKQTTEAVYQPAVVDNLENNIAEVDNVLRKAKLIREGQGDSKLTTLSSKTAKGSKQTLNDPKLEGKQLTTADRRRTYSAKLKSRKCSTGQKTKLANKASSVLQTTSQDMATLTKSEIIPIPFEEAAKVLEQAETLTLTLQEVVKADKSLTKFLKLKSMHSKIKTKSNPNSLYLPIAEELSFISSLNDTQYVKDHAVVAKSAAKQQLKEMCCKCNNLNRLLGLKNLCCNSVDVGLQLYRDRLLYRHANQIFDELYMLRNFVCNAGVILTKSDKYDEQFIQELQNSCLPLGFDRYFNIKALTQARSKITCLNLEIKLKTMFHENITFNNPQLGSNTDFVTYLKIIYGILSQNRQCTNPAVVWDD